MATSCGKCSRQALTLFVRACIDLHSPSMRRTAQLPVRTIATSASRNHTSSASRRQVSTTATHDITDEGFIPFDIPPSVHAAPHPTRDPRIPFTSRPPPPPEPISQVGNYVAATRDTGGDHASSQLDVHDEPSLLITTEQGATAQPVDSTAYQPDLAQNAPKAAKKFSKAPINTDRARVKRSGRQREYGAVNVGVSQRDAVRTYKNKVGGTGSVAPNDEIKRSKDHKELEAAPKHKKEVQPQWGVQKNALAKKFDGAGWNPAKKLSPDAMEGIRALHAQYPDQFTTPILAKQFKVSAEAIRRILKSKWKPSAVQEEDRRSRWDRRGERIWEDLVSQGYHPPKKWREMGIGVGPRKAPRIAAGRQQARSETDMGGPARRQKHEFFRSLATRLN